MDGYSVYWELSYDQGWEDGWQDGFNERACWVDEDDTSEYAYGYRKGFEEGVFET